MRGSRGHSVREEGGDPGRYHSDPRIRNALLNALPRDPDEHVRRLAGLARQA
jgi:hypothetical protein